MALRKEQGLVLGTAVLLGLFVWARDSVKTGGRRSQAKQLQTKANEIAPDIFADASEAIFVPKKRHWKPPSDSVPLPPLAYPVLPLPPLPEMPVLALPFEPGPTVEGWYVNRLFPDKLKLNTSDAVVPGEDQGEGVQPDGGRLQEKKEEDSEQAGHANTYDQIFLEEGKSRWGFVLVADKFQLGTPDPEELLAVRAPFGREIPFKVMDPEKGRERLTLNYKAEDVSRIVFANTIRNRIEMDRRRILPGIAGLKDRRAFIEKLLTKERDYPEALSEAEGQADQYESIAPNDVRGYELKAEVLARTAQFNKELAHYRELQKGPFKDRPFVLRGLGRLEEKLGLFEVAERHLRDAERQDPSDTRSKLALSSFLLRRGNASEALETIREAVSLIMATAEAGKSLDIWGQLIACLLAKGLVDEAEQVCRRAENQCGASPRMSMLKGAVLYQKGEYPAATENFLNAAPNLGTVEPIIGYGLCSLRNGQANIAMQFMERVGKEDPLERHRALAGRSFILDLLGKRTDALNFVEEARVLAPHDPYILYLRGRLLARNQDWETADEVLEQNLSRHPDLVEALAEMAWLKLEQAKHSPTEAFDLLTKGVRYAERACELEEKRAKLWVYQDLLGVMRYLLGDYEGARTAFDTSLEWGGGTHARVCLALVKYRKGDVGPCLEDLQELSEALLDPKDPYKVFVLEVKRMIEDHLGKRLFRDSFDKPEIGKHWVPIAQHRRKVLWRLFAGAKVGVSGVSQGDKNELSLRYSLDPAEDFVRLEFDLEVGPEHRGSTALMRITDERLSRAGTGSVWLEVGYERGSRLYFKEGRASKKPIFDMHEADFPEDASLKRGDPPMTIAVELRRDPENRSKGEVIVSFAGQEVAHAEVRRWPHITGRPLHFAFHVGGQKLSKLEAYLHEVRLIRKD